MIDLGTIKDKIIAEFRAMTREEFAERLRNQGHEVEIEPLNQYSTFEVHCIKSGDFTIIEALGLAPSGETIGKSLSSNAANSNELALAA